MATSANPRLPQSIPATKNASSERADRWEARLQELRKYKEEHGHCDVPPEHPGGLGSWAHCQRYPGKKKGHRLEADRRQKLEELGFRFPTATASDKWEARFRELRQFKEEHGHCHVPLGHPGGLGKWVTRQRGRGKKGSRRLEVDRTQKLEDLGFRWCGRWSDRSEARLRELEKFKEEHGHCNVPRKHPGGLGKWVTEQRSRGARHGLDADRRQKLEELGFV